MRKKLALFFISTTLTLLICELLIRVLFPQISDQDSMTRFEENLGWKFVADKEVKIIYEGGIDHVININKEGFRDAPFQDKGADSKIMVLGDSFVSNVSVKDDEVFTRLMEDQLSNTSVFNLGVNGYGQVQEYMMLKEWFPKIEPDFIVVLIYLRNDFKDNEGSDPWRYPRPTVVFKEDAAMHINPPSFSKYKSKKLLPIYYKSHLFFFVKRRISNIKSRLSKKKDTPYTPVEINTCRYPLPEEIKGMYETMEKLILEFNQFGKDTNTPVVFALAPSLVQVEDELWSKLTEYDVSINLQNDLPNKTLLSFAKENNLTMIDLMPPLQKAHRNGSRMYHPIEQHWTVEGNKVIAKVLSKKIMELSASPQDSL